jgi:hypothetical protein
MRDQNITSTSKSHLLSKEITKLILPIFESMPRICIDLFHPTRPLISELDSKSQMLLHILKFTAQESSTEFWILKDLLAV